MRLEEAIKAIHAPKGVTSMIAGAMSGDFDPIREQNAVGQSLESARQKLADVQKAQQNCGSDWAYWGYQGDISYWSAVVNILEAAAISGPENLPDMPPLDESPAVVMDMCARVEKYGRTLLEKAKAAKAPTL